MAIWDIGRLLAAWSTALCCALPGGIICRERSVQSVCMVLLTFTSQDKANSFYNDFNGNPFSSLEPEILCR